MADFSQARIETVTQGLRPMDGSDEMDAGVTLISDMSDEIERLRGALKAAAGALGDIGDGEPEWPDKPKKELKWCRRRALEAFRAANAEIKIAAKGQSK